MVKLSINVEHVVLEKDIGVNFDNKLKFSDHIAVCVKKANQKLGIIKRSFEYLDKDIFLRLYKSLIRPTLEYASVVFSPFFKKDIVAIESVQRRATKIVKEVADLPYEERLRTLGLLTLLYRRERADMVQLYKIMKNIDCVQLESISVATDSVTRGHKHKWKKMHFKYKSSTNNLRQDV